MHKLLPILIKKHVDAIVLLFPGRLIFYGVTLSLAPGICRQISMTNFNEKPATVRITYLSKIEKKKC